MKLVFKKNDKHEISVLSSDGESTNEFNYIDMIKKLIALKKMQEPEFEGDFSESEKDSVLSMINHINQEVTDFYSDSEETSG
ncbi:MAG: hypothetical protein K6L75_05020 [Cellvibrionaceae bacterium]